MTGFSALTGEHPAVEHVRVVEVGLDGGAARCPVQRHSRGSPALYAAEARDDLRDLVRGGTPEPRDACVGCKLITVCEEIKGIPGLLDIRLKSIWPPCWFAAATTKWTPKPPAMTHEHSTKKQRSPSR